MQNFGVEKISSAHNFRYLKSMIRRIPKLQTLLYDTKNSEKLFSDQSTVQFDELLMFPTQKLINMFEQMLMPKAPRAVITS